MAYPAQDEHGRKRTPWAINCPIHGLVYLTEQEYDTQMGYPNHKWLCLCGEEAEWDDDNYEEFHED